MNIDFKARLKNKAFWVSLISLTALLVQQIGFDASTIIPQNYVDITNTIFALLTLLGVIVDTSTPTLDDQK